MDTQRVQSIDNPPKAPGPFNGVRLSLRTVDALSWWSFPSAAEGYASLDDKIKACNDQFERMGLGTYVAYDCSNEKVCVVQHPFQQLRPHLEDGCFPFPVVKHSPDADFLRDIGSLTPEDQRRLLDAITANQSVLLAPNVVALVASGNKIVKGSPQPVPCIRAVVWAKGYVPLGGWCLPQTVGPIPVDVVEGPPFQTESLNTGDEIFAWAEGSVASMIGTFAAVATKAGSAARYGVTAAHVFHRAFQQGVRVYKLDTTLDDPKFELVGKLDNSRNIDAALIDLAGDTNAYTQLCDTARAQWRRQGFGFVPPRLLKCSDCIGSQSAVYKYGRKSGFTKGIAGAVGFPVIYDNNAVGDVFAFRLSTSSCMFINPDTQSTRYSLSTRFSQPGDSGALVFTLDPATNDATVVGMHIGGSLRGGQVSIALHIHDVEDALGVRFVFS